MHFTPAAIDRWIETGVGVGADIGAPILGRCHGCAQLFLSKRRHIEGPNGEATPPPAVSLIWMRLA